MTPIKHLSKYLEMWKYEEKIKKSLNQKAIAGIEKHYRNETLDKTLVSLYQDFQILKIKVNISCH